MLHVPQLDDMNYSGMFERARRMIPRLNSEWTDLNHHDPGITTLQMFYWLIDSLNYYLDATGEQHRLKYLKLLGILSSSTPSHCFVAISDEQVRMLQSTRFYAGDTVFETTKPFVGSNNPVSAIYNEVGGKIKDLSLFAGVDGSFAEVFSIDTEEECNLYIGFENPIKGDTELYIEVQPTNRNEFSDDFSLSNIEFDYYDGKSFVPCTVVYDDTNGFLRTGFVRIFAKTSTKKYKSEEMSPAHYLRCRLTHNEYDVLPAIGRILTACVEVVQTETHAATHLVEYKGDKKLPLDFCIRDNDSVTIAKKCGDEYVVHYSSKSDENRCSLVEGDIENERYILFDDDMPTEGDIFAVFVANSDIEDALTIGSSDGCAGQRLHFNADPEKICELKLALCSEKDGETVYQLWDYSDDLGSEGYDNYSFGYDRESGCIYFGDGINGMQPQQGQSVVVVTVKTSSFEGGNVLKGRIDHSEFGFEHPVLNLENAVGGSRRRNSDSLELEIEKKLSSVTRAVTAEDYNYIVMNTPGLMIDGMSVIPIKDYCKAYNEPYLSNTVVLAVKPKHGGRLPILSASYIKNIHTNLRKYRLLTTDIRVVSARYVGVSVYGRIVLSENTVQERDRVTGFISSVVDCVGEGAFGKNVDYGRLFSALELHPNVKQIGDFSLEYSGDGGYKNEQGDIVIHPDSLSYLKEIGIEFV